MSASDTKTNGEKPRFLGLTKSGFVGAAAIWIIVSTTFFIVWNIHRDTRFTHQNTRLTALVEEGQQSKLALCALKSNLEKRAGEQQTALEREKRFFETHPRAFPGVPVSLIHQGQNSRQTAINGQHETIALLDRTLSCPNGPGVDQKK